MFKQPNCSQLGIFGHLEWPQSNHNLMGITQLVAYSQIHLIGNIFEEDNDVRHNACGSQAYHEKNQILMTSFYLFLSWGDLRQSWLSPASLYIKMIMSLPYKFQSRKYIEYLFFYLKNKWISSLSFRYLQNLFV